MNTMHHSLTDLLYMMGWSAKPIFGWTLLMLVTACFAVVKRFPPSKCWAYLIAAFLPACWGVGGTVAGAMSAFATLRTFGAGDPAKFHGALWEISLPITAGFFCSAMLMTLAVFVWLRGQAKHEDPPI